jgi:DNA-binding MarR family transcriptional regulator
METFKEVGHQLDTIGLLLSRTSGRVVRATNAALHPHGLRVRQYSVLLLAAATDGGLSQRELGDALGLDPSQVVGLVDELAAAGMVERRPSPVDRRARLVVATEHGHRVRAAASAATEAALATHFSQLDDAERRLLRDLLARVGDTPA